MNEREHQRLLTQLAAEHREALESLREELSGEMRDSMEEAHQAEMLQAEVDAPPGWEQELWSLSGTSSFLSH